MFFHIATIRSASRFDRLLRMEDHYGLGIHATFGIRNGKKKSQLQMIEFDSISHTIDAARGFMQKIGQHKIKLSEGITVPSEIDICEGVASQVEILAAEGDAEAEEEPMRKFKMIAYTGGTMLTSSIPVPLIIDLKGLDTRGDKKMPILMDHKTTQRVGHSTSVSVEGTNVLASGELSAATKFTKEVTESSDNGYPWQASVGATIAKARFLNAKKSEVVNGQTVKGPVLVVDKSVLREISFVSIGADDNTSAVAASAAKNEEIEMGFDAWLKAKGFDQNTLAPEVLASLQAMFDAEAASSGSEEEEDKVEAKNDEVDVNEAAETAIKAERSRVSAIREACGTEFAEIQAEAENKGWDVAKTNQAILKAMRENRPNVNIGGPAEDAGSMKVVEAALCMRANLDEKDLVNEYGDKVMSAAYKDRTIALRDVMAAAMRADGVTAPRTFGNEFIRAALSTISLPGILGNVANKSMLKAYGLQNITATSVCSAGDLADFKQASRYRLNELGAFDEVGATGEIKHGTAGEESATNQLSTYGKMITLSRQMIINDDLSALTKLPAAMAARAAQKIDELFYTRLLSNPGTMFATANGNYQEGTNTALSVGSMDSALQLFKDQTTVDGLPINVMPRFLLVPTSLTFTARQLINSSMLGAVGAGATVAVNTYDIPTANPLQQENLTIVESPYLNSQGLTGTSALGWYLFGDPAVVDTFEIGYLRGKRTPTLEQVALPADMLGMGWRIYFDLGVREQDHRGIVFSKGEA